MSDLSLRRLLAVGLVLTAATAASADDASDDAADEGFIRLQSPTADSAVTPASHAACTTGQCESGQCGPGGCPSGLCGRGGLFGGHGGYGGYGDCPPGGGCRCWGCNNGRDCIGDKLRCLFGVYGGCSHAPGAGYVTPSRRPIWDLSLPTSTMWSGQWTCGKGGAHPSTRPAVYMPTDTTQLGYSYSHVPYWMPKAGMVPPIPNPGDWHNRTCFNRCQSCRGGAAEGFVDGGYPGGAVIDGGSSCPTGAGGPAGLPEVASKPILPNN